MGDKNMPPSPTEELPTFEVRYNLDTENRIVIQGLRFLDGFLVLDHGPLLPKLASAFLLRTLVEKEETAAHLHIAPDTVANRAKLALRSLDAHTAGQAVSRLFTPPFNLLKVLTPVKLDEEPTARLVEFLQILSTANTYGEGAAGSKYWTYEAIRTSVMPEVRKWGLKTPESLVMWGFATHILGEGRPVFRSKAARSKPTFPKVPTLVLKRNFSTAP